MPGRDARAMNDHQLAATLAHEAGGLLMRVREQAVWEGLDQKALKDRGDHDSNVYLLDRLQEERPDDAVLSEESKDDPIRLTSPISATHGEPRKNSRRSWATICPRSRSGPSRYCKTNSDLSC